jgi:hypothetical protein
MNDKRGGTRGVMMRAGKNQIGLNQDDWKKERDRNKGTGCKASTTIFSDTPA